jgi:hypothetical protein
MGVIVIMVMTMHIVRRIARSALRLVSRFRRLGDLWCEMGDSDDPARTVDHAGHNLAIGL